MKYFNKEYYKHLTIRTSESGLVLDDEEKMALDIEKWL